MTAIPVTSSAGVQLTGLTVGVQYSVWTQGGPWHPHGLSVGDDSYTFQLSDNGSSWSGGIGTSYDPIAPQSDAYIPSWASSRKNLDSVHVLVTFTAGATSVWIRVFDNVFGDNTGSLDAEIGPGSLPFCQYGTQPQGALTGGVIITTALIDVLLLALDAPAALAVIFDGFVGKTIFAGDICSGLPPLMPQFVNADFLSGTDIPNPASLGKFWQGFQAVAWPHFCECTPGGIGPPPAIPVPPPLVIAPPGAPIAPIAVACDSTDLCGLLNALMRQLAGMSASIAQLRSDVTLIQRQGVPFGYLTGSVHSALTGSGSWTIADILGVAVTFDALPPELETGSTTPPTYHQVGKISLGTINGWRRSWQPTHSPYLILPVSGAFTRLGYTFSDGVVATITELLREP
jgi:hypothetical protein